MKSLALRVLLAVAALVGASPESIAQEAMPGRNDEVAPGHRGDSLPHPRGLRQARLRKLALEAKLAGKAKGRVHQVARGQYVELERMGEDSIWTVLAEFGPDDHPAPILHSGVPGPLHNQIPPPDRTVDNTTIWAPDFSEAYYENLLFSQAPGAVSMRNFYIEESSNRYTVNGDVTDWVAVPYNAAAYGRNYCGGIVCAQTWAFVNHSIDAWYAARIAAGTSEADIDAYLARFDVWDRYDHDGDGNFDEPDGYIDHFQSVHAGEGEETGGGAQGQDAIWSHRWYAYFSANGPDGAGPHGFGGVRIGQSRYWIGDYTIEPENGGVGVFAHEFGHDLGLPDLYDTSGNTGGAENSTGFWTLYSSGSYGSTGVAEEGIGSKPIPMSAYEKIFLGWSNYAVVGHRQTRSLKLGPATTNTKQVQQLVLLLPDKRVAFQIHPPYAGNAFYHSGSGNDLDNTMTRQVALPAGALLSAKIRYEIEEGWDYAYLTVNGTAVPTNRSTNTNPNGQNFGNGITGTSDGNWIDLTADLSAFGGQTVTLGFRYWTDGAVAEPGIGIDEIAITGSPIDGAEQDAGWSYAGFSRAVDGIVTQSFFNAYFAEYRNYRGYDDGLRTGPYNFGFTDNPSLGNFVEHFPYQDGLLVWYYDTSFPDNNVGDHCLSGRCGGLFLPVDAHPELLLRPDNGKVWRPRIQSFDSTFGLKPTGELCLHALSLAQCYPSLPGNPLFDDMQSYWSAPDPAIGNFGWASVPLPRTGSTIRVLSVSAQDGFMQVVVNQK